MIFPHDPIADREALQALAERCKRFSPLVGLEQSPDPSSLLLDVTGLAHLFGGETALGEAITRDFARRGLTVRVAIADTIGAAWAVARYGKRKAEGGKHPFAICKLQFAICNLQSALAKPQAAFRLPPSAFFLVPPGRTAAVLRPLPVEALRLPEETVELLRQLGIDRIEQLDALPRREFLSRFGPEVLRRWDQATGRLAEPVPAREPPPEFKATWSPEHPTARRATVEAALQRLLDRLCGMLHQCGRGALRLECRLDCQADGTGKVGPGKVEPVRISLGLFEPTAAAEHLGGLVRMQLERLWLPGPVTAIEATAPATARLVPKQQPLFANEEDRRQAATRHVASLIDRLSSRLGRRAVLRVRFLADAQPELAWCYDPLVDGGSRRRRSRRPLPADLPPRPLRLLRRPLLLRATSMMPDGAPLRFRLHGHEHQVAETWGPERIETGWWRGRMIGRDYYQIETTAGRRYWLFRRLRDQRWFLHGTFE